MQINGRNWLFIFFLLIILSLLIFKGLDLFELLPLTSFFLRSKAHASIITRAYIITMHLIMPPGRLSGSHPLLMCPLMNVMLPPAHPKDHIEHLSDRRGCGLHCHRSCEKPTTETPVALYSMKVH